jgi:hypothetical protein
MKIRSTLFLALISFAALATDAMTSTAVMEKIKNKGAGATLRALYESNAQWSALLVGISSGKKEWLAIATQLKSVSDAGASEQLTLAVGEALEHQPNNVLTYTVPRFTISDICSGPDVDDTRFNSLQLAMAAIERRQQMLRSVKNESLARLRDECLVGLEHAKTRVADFSTVPK